MPNSLPASSDLEWPILERSGLTRRIRAAVERRGCLLVGPAGCGKSTLVDLVVPAPLARIIASDAGRSVPGWGISSLTGEEVTPATAPPLLHRFVERSNGGRAKPVLVVENVDSLDDLSASALAQMVANGRLRTIVTRGTPSSTSSHAVTQLTGLLTRTDIAPLDDDETSALLRRALGGPTDGRALATLTALAQGDPSLLREIVTDAIDHGSFVARDGIWNLAGPLPVSPTLRVRTSEITAGLDPVSVDALGLLTYAGPLPMEVALDLIDADALECLERDELITLEDDDAYRGPRVRVASPLVEFVTEHDLPTLARRRHARDLTAAIEQLDARRDELEPRSTLWSIDAGADLDSARALGAARLAIEEGDTGVAERIAHVAVAAGGSTEAVLLESWCVDELGDAERAERILVAHVPQTPQAALAVAIRRAELLFWFHRAPERAAVLLDETEAAIGAPWTLAVEAQRTVFDTLDGETDRAIERSADLVSRPELLISSTAALARGVSLAIADRAEEGRAVADSLLERLGDEADSLYVDPGVHVITLAFCLVGLGHLEEADQLTQDVYRHTLGRPGRRAQGWSALIRAQVLLARGRPSAAAESAMEAELIWGGAQLDGMTRWSATLTALSHAEEGNADALHAAIERAEASEPVGFRLFAPDLQRARAWAAHLGASADAADQFVAAARAAQRRGQAMLAAAAAHDLIRIGRADLAAECLAAIPTTGPVTALRRRLATAVCTDDVAEIGKVANSFEAIGASGWAAEALAHAHERQPSPARRMRGADLVAGSGLATPPITRMLEQPAPTGLTAREWEVTRLAGSGLTNREIADRLVVSLRTVENHLHRSFGKLGVTSRSELPADALRAVGPRRA